MRRLRTLSSNAAMFVIGGLAFAVFTTGTAVAVTTTAVAITDAGTGTRAHVTQKQSLVTSGRDPLTGSYQRIDAGGATLVSDLPGKRWNTLDGENVSGSSGTAKLAETTIPHKIALSSLVLAASGSAGTVLVQVSAFISNTSAGDCATLSGATFSIAERMNLVLQTGTTQQLTWPSPLVWSDYGQSGHKLCMDIQGYSGPSGWSVAVTANGFYV
jgi:hypothetical protein